MNITTKFDINQKVWFVCCVTRKIKCEKVKGIKIYLNSIQPISPIEGKKYLVRTGEYKACQPIINYELESSSAKNEREFMLYTTKEELLQSISE